MYSTNSEIQSDSDQFFSYFRYYGYIRYIFIVTAEEFCKTSVCFVYKSTETDIFMTFTFLCTSILTFCS